MDRDVLAPPELCSRVQFLSGWSPWWVRITGESAASSIQPPPPSGIDDLDELEPPEARVAGVDAADPVLSHEDGRVGVVDQVAREAGRLVERPRRDLTVALAMPQDPRARRREKRLDEPPRRRCGPRARQHAWVGDDTNDLVDDTPREKPRERPPAQLFEERPAPGVLHAVRVGCVDEHARVDDEHPRLLRHRLVQRFSIRDVD
jgi:hypothetical protein